VTGIIILYYKWIYMLFTYNFLIGLWVRPKIVPRSTRWHACYEVWICFCAVFSPRSARNLCNNVGRITSCFLSINDKLHDSRRWLHTDQHKQSIHCWDILSELGAWVRLQVSTSCKPSCFEIRRPTVLSDAFRSFLQSL
jgi:hypothetical protein